MEYFKRQSPTGFDVFEQTPTGERKIELPEFQSLGLNVDLLSEKPITLEQGRDVETRAFIASGGQLGQPSAAQTAGFGFTPSPQGTEEGGTLTVPQGINIEGFTRGLTPEAKQLAQQGAVTTGALPQEQTNFYQNLEERLKKSDDFVSQLMSLYVPTPQETELQKQIDELTMAAKEGVIEAGQRPATMGFVTGTQRAIEQRANTKLEGIQRELQRLGGNRQGQLQALTTAYNIGRQNIQDMLAFYQKTAPEKLFVDDKNGIVYFQNPISGEIFERQLPGFRPQEEERPTTSAITEYQFAREQGFKGSFEDWQRLKSTQFGTEGGGGKEVLDDITSYAQRLNAGQITVSNVPQTIRGQVLTEAKRLAETDLEEDIKIGNQQGLTREQLQDKLATAYPEFTKQEIHNKVYALIPDKPAQEEGGTEDSFFKRLLGF